MYKLFFYFSTLFSLLWAVNLHTCTECHGEKFEKSAMGISKIVKDLPKEELKKALIGYKENTHGGTMQNIMNLQISKFTYDEIDDIVNEIFDDNITNISEDKNITSKISVDLTKCASCHGANFEKTAFGFSRIVAKMSQEEIKAALLGYASGIYGGERRALMMNQIINYSKEEIEAIAKEIFSEYHYK